MTTLTVKCHRMPHNIDLPLPSRATDGAAGLDLLAACEDEVILSPGERALIPTGLRVEIPAGYEGQVRGRSGLALKRGLGVPNAPGTIDSDYRGEVSVILINWSGESQTIRRGERVAQLVIAPVARAELVEADDLEPTKRGTGGFGHSGV